MGFRKVMGPSKLELLMYMLAPKLPAAIAIDNEGHEESQMSNNQIKKNKKAS